MERRQMNLAYANTSINGTHQAVNNENKTKMRGSEILVLSISGFIVVLFAYTGINKFLAQDNFVFQMQLVPVEIVQKAAPYLGWIVPTLELIIIGIIIPDKTRFVALIASFSLMVIFEVYIILMHSMGIDLPCSCGGIISRMDWDDHVAFNGVVIGMLALAIYLEKRTWWNSIIKKLFKGIIVFGKGKKSIGQTDIRI